MSNFGENKDNLKVELWKKHYHLNIAKKTLSDVSFGKIEGSSKEAIKAITDREQLTHEIEELNKNLKPLIEEELKNNTPYYIEYEVESSDGNCIVIQKIFYCPYLLILIPKSKYQILMIQK